MEFRIKNVLVLTNFSDCANNAVQLAAAIAQRQGATLHLLHALEQPLFSRVAISEDKIISAHQKAVEEARSKLWLCAEIIVANSVIRVKTHTIVGRLAGSIPKFEKDKEIDLTIVGMHAIKGIRELLSESMAMQVVKASTCATMTVPPEFDKTHFESLLFPIRDVEGVEEKYRYLEPILKKNNAALHLLGVYSVTQDSDIFPVTDRLKALHDEIPDASKITYEVLSSSCLPDTVLDTASKRKSDLIVINASLDEKWYRLLTGRSYTHQLVRKSVCPVLCIKPQLIAMGKENADEELFTDDIGYLPINFSHN